MEGIFEDAQTSKPEVKLGILHELPDLIQGCSNRFQPGILDPGEEIKIHMKLKSMIGAQTTNWTTIATSNGVPVSAFVIR